MTQDEIIEMAKQAGASKMISKDGVEKSLTSTAKIIAFAKLVAQHEREACAKVCDEIYFQKYPDAEEWERSEEGEAIRERGQA